MYRYIADRMQHEIVRERVSVQVLAVAVANIEQLM